MKDPANVLVNAQEGVTKALRQLRFRSNEAIDDELVAAYVREAIENQRQGLVIKVDRDKPVVVPEALAAVFLVNTEARGCFDKLRKGLQREYIEYIEEAKREDTRGKRLEKILPMILAGTGLNDRYRE